jgi:hypothetical protein
MTARVSFHQYSDLCFNGLARIAHASTFPTKAKAEALVTDHLAQVQTRWHLMDSDDIDSSLEDLMVTLIRLVRSLRIPLK